VSIDLEPDQDRQAADVPRRRGDLGRTLVRGVGQTLITFGLICLLFIVYEVWVTDIFAARAQDQLSQQIHQQWSDDPTVAAPTPAPAGAPFTPAAIDVTIGDPFAVLHIPRLAGGAGFSRVVVEGTSQVQLAQGPGHYLGTAMPGQQGNAAFAGHRVGRGSPFLDLDKLRPGDPIVVETGDAWFVYRVLGDPATGDFSTDPSGIPGREIVLPTALSVIAPTPGGPTGGPATGAYLTLTTCHPKFSARQRMVIHARLDGPPLSRASAPNGPAALEG